MAAEAVPPFVAGVAVAGGAIAGGAVARGAVTGGIAELTLTLPRWPVGAPSHSSSSSSPIRGVTLLTLQAGGRDPPDGWRSSSLPFQELIELREPFNREAAGQRAPTAGAGTLGHLQGDTPG